MQCSKGILACTEYLNLWRNSSIEPYPCTPVQFILGTQVA